MKRCVVAAFHDAAIVAHPSVQRSEGLALSGAPIFEIDAHCLAVRPRLVKAKRAELGRKHDKADVPEKLEAWIDTVVDDAVVDVRAVVARWVAHFDELYTSARALSPTDSSELRRALVDAQRAGARAVLSVPPSHGTTHWWPVAVFRADLFIADVRCADCLCVFDDDSDSDDDDETSGRVKKNRANGPRSELLCSECVAAERGALEHAPVANALAQLRRACDGVGSMAFATRAWTHAVSALSGSRAAAAERVRLRVTGEGAHSAVNAAAQHVFQNVARPVAFVLCHAVEETRTEATAAIAAAVAVSLDHVRVLPHLRVTKWNFVARLRAALAFSLAAHAVTLGSIDAVRACCAPCAAHTAPKDEPKRACATVRCAGYVDRSWTVRSVYCRACVLRRKREQYAAKRARTDE